VPVKVLVTGGAGLIGSHIVDATLQRGDEVRILDNLDEQTHPRGQPDWIPSDAEFIHGDVRNPADLQRALRGVEGVFHQAAFGGFTAEISKYADSNALGTVRLFEAIRASRAPVRKIVLASSQAIYGEGLYECPEDGPQEPLGRPVEQLEKGEWEVKCPLCGRFCAPRPTPEGRRKDGATMYALTKRAQEEWGLALGKQMGIAVVATRYALTYGPRQSIFNPYTGVVSIFSTLLCNGKSVVLYEDGLQTRDLIYVGDVAAANLFLMDYSAADGHALNVGTGRATSMMALAQALCREYGAPGKVELPSEFRPGDSRHVIHDPSQLRAMGFEATTTLEDGLRRFAEWIRRCEDVRDRFSDALERLRGLRVVRRTRS
jgi:dTDP-L-rhamnose 4-epimerase